MRRAPLGLLLLAACLPHPVESEPEAGADPAVVTWIGDGVYLAGLSPAEATGPWTLTQQSPDTWIAATPDVDATRPPNSEWRVGGVSCRVSGYAAVVQAWQEYYADDDGNRVEEPLAPTCGSPALFAKLDCAGPVEAELANPRRAAAIVEESGTPAPDLGTNQALALLAAVPEWAVAVASAGDQATATGEAVNQVFTFTRYAGGRAPHLLLDAQVMTGDGQNYCGGEAFFTRFLVLAPEAEGAAPLLVASRDDLAEVTHVVDTDGDGIPELRLLWWGHDMLVGAGGAAQTLRQETLCVCGC